MVKYTEEELLKFQDEAYVSHPDILEAFNQLVDNVIELSNAKKIYRSGDTFIDENGNERSYQHFNRRRGSRSGSKPIKKKTGEVAVDDDGWATLSAKHKKSFTEDSALDDKDKFKETYRDATKAKPNNKKLGSNKAVDPRDTIADKQTINFNAFEALGDGDDE